MPKAIIANPGTIDGNFYVVKNKNVKFEVSDKVYINTELQTSNIHPDSGTCSIGRDESDYYYQNGYIENIYTTHISANGDALNSNLVIEGDTTVGLFKGSSKCVFLSDTGLYLGSPSDQPVIINPQGTGQIELRTSIIKFLPKTESGGPIEASTNPLPVQWGGTGQTSLNSVTVGYANRLSQPNTFKVNLAANASDNLIYVGQNRTIEIGISGILSTAHGGTGADNLNKVTVGAAGQATKLATPRSIRINLESTQAINFDGTANITPGVYGTLPIANGGTNAATAAQALINLGAAPASHSHNYLSLTGGTITGNLRLKNNSNFGLGINFGDGDYVKISEPEDDVLEIKANELRFQNCSSCSSNPLPINCGGTGVTSYSALRNYLDIPKARVYIGNGKDNTVAFYIPSDWSMILIFGYSAFGIISTNDVYYGALNSGTTSSYRGISARATGNNIISNEPIAWYSSGNSMHIWSPSGYINTSGQKYTYIVI